MMKHEVKSIQTLVDVGLVVHHIDNDSINKVDSLAGSIQVNLEALIVAWKILLSLEIVWVIFIVIGHGSV